MAWPTVRTVPNCLSLSQCAFVVLVRHAMDSHYGQVGGGRKTELLGLSSAKQAFYIYSFHFVWTVFHLSLLHEFWPESCKCSLSIDWNFLCNIKTSPGGMNVFACSPVDWLLTIRWQLGNGTCRAIFEALVQRNVCCFIKQASGIMLGKTLHMHFQHTNYSQFCSLFNGEKLSPNIRETFPSNLFWIMVSVSKQQ